MSIYTHLALVLSLLTVSSAFSGEPGDGEFKGEKITYSVSRTGAYEADEATGLACVKLMPGITPADAGIKPAFSFIVPGQEIHIIAADRAKALELRSQTNLVQLITPYFKDRACISGEISLGLDAFVGPEAISEIFESIKSLGLKLERTTDYHFIVSVESAGLSTTQLAELLRKMLAADTRLSFAEHNLIQIVDPANPSTRAGN